MSKKVLVTGIAGFLGSHIAERLVELGYEVVGVDNLSTGKPKNIKKIFDKIEFHWMSLEHFDIENKDIDIICHQAALCNVPHSMKDPDGYFENNVAATHRMLMEARKYNIKKIVIASSSAAEECISPYGMSKKVTEDYSNHYRNLYDMDITNLRYFNVYGPRQSMDSQHSMVIPIFINKLLKGESPTIYGDGEQSRDFIYVDDVVDANIAAIEGDHQGTWDVGSGESTKIIDLFNWIKALIGAEVDPIFTKKRPGDPFETEAIVSGRYWQPKTDMSDGLIKTIEWWKNENV
ncbi:MAG: NAD-dependent epimerase/dehydratase family protein [PVC group bacterium]|nr:NAD-dependent epimerase/dehydratase family protein [PVC group bacterium]